MPVSERIAAIADEAQGWRRDFHAHPELMYDLPRTAARVAELLRTFGCDEVVEGIGRTGVVGVVRGSREGERTVGLRADMDALPIEEQTGAPYASTVPGMMHACGHDGHTAMLLAAAKALCDGRDFAGTVILVFQPAEEGGAGALAMCDDGLMERFAIDEIYALHNEPGLPIGHFAIRSGPLLASSDEFEIIVTGRGGHAAEPHRAIDATLVAAHLLIALQSVVSRNVDPLHRVVLTVGTFETDSRASNVIAETVRMKGTVRTLDPSNRTLARERIGALAQGMAAGFGAQAALDWSEGYPVTINTPDETDHAIAAARAISDRVEPSVDPIMPSEDFAYMLERRPGAYIMVGNGNSAACHHPAYDFDDRAIPFGASWYLEIARSRLSP